MSNDLFRRLLWLAEAPEDFAEQCRAAMQDAEGAGPRLQALARYRLGGEQLTQLAAVLRTARHEGWAMEPLVPFRLGVLSHASAEFLVPAVEASALRHGIALECVTAGQMTQAAADPESAINRARLDAVLLALDVRSLPLRAVAGDAAGAAAAVAETLEYVRSMGARLREYGGATVMVGTVPPLPEGLFGSLDRVLPGAPRQMVDALNRGLAESVRGTGDVLLDVAALAETVGLADWHSPAQWNVGRLPFAVELLPLYADHVGRMIAAMRGKTRRCLVLDLDDTAWGGVVGDEGPEGIRMAAGDAAGEAHLAVQRMVLALRERGVVLAVSSKSDDAVTRRVLREHPEMLLREEHLAVLQANGEDKATNLRAIAEELKLDLDAMVLLDNNPAERALVRRVLPEVAVPELPSDPALFARMLGAAGYFESVTFAGQELCRPDFYQNGARRATLAEPTHDMEEYLRSLEMEITFQPFDCLGRDRIVELINKSNQYNLTVRRYTVAEVAAMEQDPQYFTLQARLTDVYGDSGTVGVVICRETRDAVWGIDTWLMSCRVLGRRLPEAVMAELLRHAEAARVERLMGLYRPTDRNGMAAGHYESLGFLRTGDDEAGSTWWELPVRDAVRPAVPMRMRSIGFSLREG